MFSDTAKLLYGSSVTASHREPWRALHCPTRRPSSPATAAPRSSPPMASCCCCRPRTRPPICAACRRRCWSMRRRRSAGSACAACRHSICWSCSPSPCRRAPRRRRRAASPWRWTSSRRTAAWKPQAALLPELVAALLHRLAQGRDIALNRDAAGLAARMGQAGWGWAPVRHGRARPAGRRAVERGAARVEAPAGVGGRGTAAAAFVASGRGGRGTLAARRACWGRTPSSGRARRTMPAPPRPPSRRARPAAIRIWCWRRPAPAPARRSAIWRRPACGRRRTTAACGSAPSPATCSARSTPNWRTCSPTRPSGTSASWCARAARTTCAC